MRVKLFGGLNAQWMVTGSMQGNIVIFSLHWEKVLINKNKHANKKCFIGDTIKRKMNPNKCLCSHNPPNR